MTLMGLLVTALALVAAGCGGDDDDGGSTSAESAETPATALAEIPAVRKGLADGLAAYRAGDAAKADQLIGDVYLEHFEHVEGPLGEIDQGLMSNLEQQIASGVREQIKAGDPVKKVQASIAQINKGLDQAQAALSAK
jgi:DNA anti-recombination protein RmuC